MFAGVGFVYIPQCCQVSQPPRYMPAGETQLPLKERVDVCVRGEGDRKIAYLATMHVSLKGLRQGGKSRDDVRREMGSHEFT